VLQGTLEQELQDLRTQHEAETRRLKEIIERLQRGSS